VLGSNSFIPGFEPEVIGLKLGDTKTFVITFPKNYGVSALQNRKVEFTITAQKVQEVVETKLDDAFAAKVGPFKNVAELKEDIKKELTARKESDTSLKYADDLVLKIADKSKVSVPESLVAEQLERLERDQRQNLTYRGQTWQEYLTAEKLTDETYREKIKPEAEKRVKVALVLAEIAEAEQITVTPEEVETQISILKTQYPDPQMQTELNKPEARRSITSRLLTQKTVDRLVDYSSKG
jgi:trigger factor